MMTKLIKILLQTPHISPSRASYGVSVESIVALMIVL